VRSAIRTTLVNALLAMAVLPRDREAMIGDLEEELALRSRWTPTQSAQAWYWRQVWRSLLPSLLQDIRRGGWLGASFVALAAIVVQAVLEWSAIVALSALMAPDRVPAIIPFVLGLSTLTTLGYLSAAFRPGAATLLAAITLVAAVAVMLLKGDMGSWYRVTVVALGPLAPVIGGALRRQGHAPGLGGQ
jgi:hypothetical protein